MCQELSELVAAARTVVSSLDVASMTGAEATRSFELFASLERLAAAAKILVAPRLADSDEWARQGHRSATEWMAKTSGTSVGDAKRVADTAAKVAGLGATQDALRSGNLSPAQAAAVADGAAADPDAEAELLEAAARESVRSLRDKARRVVLNSRGTVEQRYARQRNLRSFNHWTDDEGMVAGRFRLTPDAGSAVIKAIQREADRHYRLAYREGRRESPENYAADALVALITGKGLLGKRNSSGSEVVVVLSYEALRRGFANPDADPDAKESDAKEPDAEEPDLDKTEFCEVPGFGAVPVSKAREMLADAFLKGVVADGTRVTHVKHFGRHRPAEVDTALMVQSFLSHGGLRCSVEGCDRTVGLEWDHEVPFAGGGPTSAANLNALCRHHHVEKGAGKMARRGGRWVRAGAGAGGRTSGRTGGRTSGRTSGGPGGRTGGKRGPP